MKEDKIYRTEKETQRKIPEIFTESLLKFGHILGVEEENNFPSAPLGSLQRPLIIWDRLTGQKQINYVYMYLWLPHNDMRLTIYWIQDFISPGTVRPNDTETSGLGTEKGLLQGHVEENKWFMTKNPKVPRKIQEAF